MPNENQQIINALHKLLNKVTDNDEKRAITLVINLLMYDNTQT